VERRQASAPGAEGGVSRSFVWRVPHPFGAVVGQQRLPAFRFPFVFVAESELVWLPEASVKEI
jgi:hypothetical protein